MKDRNLNLSSKKLENSRKILEEELKIKKNSSLSPSKGTQDFLDHIHLWQIKKQNNLKLQKDLKDTNELKDLKFSPTLNENSKKILEKLKNLKSDSRSPLNLTSTFSKNHLSTIEESSFHPSLTLKTHRLTLNRTKSVFERLYPSKSQKTQKTSDSIKKPRSRCLLSLSQLDKSYSINSGKGIISEKNFIEEIKYDKSMKFLLDDYFK
jgi:hypothetical protein